MFCPGCGFQVSDDLKFCKQCGANLHSVRDAMSSLSNGEKSDWSKKWWAGMLYSPEDIERLCGITPTPEEKRLREEKKRLNEIKGGVITGLIGIGVMIVFYFFFGAVANAATPRAAEIVSKLWMLGIIPTLIGAGLLINGFFISRRLVKLSEQLARAATPSSQTPASLPAKTTDQLVFDPAPSNGASVIEDTTAHLPEAVHAAARRETD
jgi:hypothetical protein